MARAHVGKLATVAALTLGMGAVAGPAALADEAPEGTAEHSSETFVEGMHSHEAPEQHALGGEQGDAQGAPAEGEQVTTEEGVNEETAPQDSAPNEGTSESTSSQNDMSDEEVIAMLEGFFGQSTPTDEAASEQQAAPVEGDAPAGEQNAPAGEQGPATNETGAAE